jgi:hypothetical protein
MKQVFDLHLGPQESGVQESKAAEANTCCHYVKISLGVSLCGTTMQSCGFLWSQRWSTAGSLVADLLMEDLFHQYQSFFNDPNWTLTG